MAALLAARIGLGDRWLWFYDIPKVTYPNAVFWHDHATHFALPLWIDRLGMGFPAYAEGQIGSFYLPNLLIYQFDPITAMDLTRVLHLAFAGIGAGLVARRLSADWLAAIVAAIGTVLAGGILGKLEWTNVVVAYAWAPWVLWPILRWPGPSRLGLVGAATAWGIAGLAGHPNTWLLIGIAAVVAMFAVAPRRSTVPRIVGFLFLGAAVASVQLIPTLIVWSLSTRASGLQPWDIFANSPTPLDLLLPGFANAFVQAGPDGWNFATQWYPGGPWALHEAGAYLGLPMLALVGLGAAAPRSRPLVAVAVVMIGIAVVGSFRPGFWVDTPILNGLRNPSRAYMFACLVCSIMAGVGLSRAGKAGTSIRPAVLLVSGSIATYLVVLFVAVVRPDLFGELVRWAFDTPQEAVSAVRDAAVRALTKPFPVAIEVALGGMSIAVLAAARRRASISPRWVVDVRQRRLILAALAAIPLMALSPGINQVGSLDQFSQAERPYVQAVAAFSGHRIVALIDPSWYEGIPNQLAAAGINELTMFSSLNLASTDALVDDIRYPMPDTTLARAAGVDVMATFGGAPCPGSDVVTLQNDGASVCRLEPAPTPPYWLPLDAVGAESHSAAGGWGRSALALLGAVPVDRTVDADRAVSEGQPVTVAQWDETSARLVVDAPDAGWLYIDRAWWPSWHVTVNGQVVVPERGLAGQLVRVPAGRSVVQQSLVPTDVGVGLTLGLVALALAFAWMRRSPGTPREVALHTLPEEHLGEEDLSVAQDAAAEWKNDESGGEPLTHDEDRPLQPGGNGSRTDSEPFAIAPMSRAGIAGLLVGLAGATALVWLVPPVAFLLVWPILFALPGWVIVARVAPRLPTPGQVGIALVASAYLSAHLVNVVARLGGFGLPAVMVSTLLLACGTVVFGRARYQHLAPLRGTSARAIRIALRRYAAAWIIASVVGLVVLVILFGNSWRQTSDGFVSGGWNWSDFLVHVSIATSIVHGNFPPEVPYFAGVPLTYHWFADFYGAIAATAVRVDVIPVFFLTSALFASALAMLVWTLALTLTGRRRIATIATLLVCFGGGMGWVRLVGDLVAGGSNVVSLIAQTSYDNSWAGDWPFFRIASLMSTGFVPHRATTLGLPGLIAVVLLCVTCIGRRPAGVLLAGILAGLLAPFHLYAFPATYLIVFLFVAVSGAWRSRTIVRDALLFLGPSVLAIPFVASAAFQQSERGAFHLVAGWSEARFADGPLAVLFFYVTNLGLPFVLAVAAGLVSRGFPGRGFLVAWMFALFLVPNLLVVSAVEFDMNKYFQIMWIAVGILAARLVSRWPRPVIISVILVSAISPALVGTWQLWNPALALTTAQEEAGRWIEYNTPDRAVFVTDAFINSPVDLAGRLRISTFGPYAANLGYDPAPREADIHSIYCDGPARAVATMSNYGATYVLGSGGLLDCGEHDPTDFSTSSAFDTMYQRDGVTIWRLHGRD